LNTVYLVRHGENSANLTKEFSYQKVDYSLTPKGVLQSQQTAAYFLDKNIQEIYASPLKRAQETAAIIAQALGLPMTVMEQFREINVGTLEGQPPTPDLWRFHNQILIDWVSGKPDSRFPGGEDYHMLLARMRDGLDTILSHRRQRNIIIVGHGGIFLCTLQDICRNVNMKEVLASDYANCSIAEIAFQREHGQLVGLLEMWGCHTHLSGEAAVLVPALPDPA
jgi:broad specificity phosphatase PhoE